MSLVLEISKIEQKLWSGLWMILCGLKVVQSYFVIHPKTPSTSVRAASPKVILMEKSDLLLFL